MKLRAMRGVGELTSQIEKLNKHKTQGTNSETLTKESQLKKVGLTKQTVSRYEKLAKVPEERFEEVIEKAIQVQPLIKNVPLNIYQSPQLAIMKNYN